MRKVLVVDDEPFVRATIISILDWNGLDYSKPVEAGNGREALKILREDSFDLVLLDMSMPVMTGIEFLRNLDDPDIRHRPAVIVLSAYDDFSLVRESFKLGVCNYALKSEIDANNLLNLLSEAEPLLSGHSDYENKYGTSPDTDPEMRRLALNELLTVPLTSECRSLLECLGIGFSYPLTLFCIRIQDPEGFNNSNNLDERRRLQNLISSTALDVVSPYGSAESFLTLSGEHCILLSGGGSKKINDTAEPGTEISRRIMHYLNLIVSVDLEDNVNRLQDIHFAWQSLRSRHQQGSRIVVHARRYIEKHYKQNRISLDEVAESAGVSGNHLCTQFKKETGMNITDYVADLRITEAARLLQQSSMLVYEVASYVGYASVEHFSRQFKRIMGCSPNKYIGGRPQIP